MWNFHDPCVSVTVNSEGRLGATVTASICGVTCLHDWTAHWTYRDSCSHVVHSRITINESGQLTDCVIDTHSTRFVEQQSTNRTLGENDLADLPVRL